MVNKKYLDNQNTEDLALIRVHIPEKSKDFKKLSHRDYLGSVMALGLKRNVIGDIIVCEDGADISVSKAVAKYLLSELKQIGRVNVRTEILDIEEIRTSEIKTVPMNFTVASLRLDNIISSAFKISRGKAQEEIRKGMAAVNGADCTKTDYMVKLDDKVSLRHYGKVMMSEIGGTNKKDRIHVIVEKFI